MVALSKLAEEAGHTVCGQYLLSRAESRTAQTGEPFMILQLSDYSGHLTVYAWENDGLLYRVPPHVPAVIQAGLKIRRFHGEIIANLTAIHTLEPHEIENAAALLSIDTCPPSAHPALDNLVEFLATLQPPVLRQFLTRVLLDATTASSLCSCKASQHNHHHMPGGLLIHSIEVLQIATDMTRDRLDPVEQSITQVAALLHDLGKIRAVGAGNVRPIHYLVASHEAQTTRILDPHLQWLRDRAPDIADGLEYIFEFISQPPATRGRARFLGAQIVVAADRTSAALDDHKRLPDLLSKLHPGHRRQAPATLRDGTFGP